jgi:Domain of unknown function (DUF4190)
MYCTRCGTYNSDESVACSNCSARLVKPAEIRQGAQSSSGTEPYPNPLEQPTQTIQPNTGYSSIYAGQPAYQSYQNIQANQVARQQGNPSGQAIAAMVLSLVSPFTCWFLLSIPGMILGKKEMTAIQEGRAPAGGETFAKIGYYLGLILTIIYFLFGLSLVFLAVLSSPPN